MCKIEINPPSPNIMLIHESGVSFDSGVSIEQLSHISNIDLVEVVESEDHFCTLKYEDMEIKTNVPYELENEV